jgi:ABC-type Mn2+/Zn2+ transport system permease subunit
VNLENVLALLAVGAIAVACATLSVFVVARRWAFIGEGIGHSGFGGAGTAWIAMLLWPQLNNRGWVIYLAVIAFCLATALAIGYVSRGPRISTDTAIGIFMVASLAWGFLAQQIFRQVVGAEPAGFGEILFGRFSGLAPKYALAVIAVSVAVVATLVAVGKEIVYYCLDPLAAEASGVPAGFVHYLLMLLIAVTVVIGIPLTGSPLVTALLVLPGATANLLSQKLRNVLTISIGMTLAAAVGGVCLSRRWGGVYVPAGPAIVLVLFAIFVVVFATTKIRTTRVMMME